MIALTQLRRMRRLGYVLIVKRVMIWKKVNYFEPLNRGGFLKYS
jgi:hypothetical protein